jgi:uncharacterized membrane protein YbhN (UPF0104 family)
MNDDPVGVELVELEHDRRSVGRWVTVVGAVVVGAFAVWFIVANRADVPATWRATRNASPAWVVVGLLATAAWMVNLGMFHAAAQRAVGMGTAPLSLTQTAAAGHSLNIVTKSGAMAGLVVFDREARGRAQPRGVTVVAYVIVQVIGDVAFAATLIVALVVVAIDGQLTRAEIVAGVVFGTFLVVKSSALLAALRSRESVRRLYGLPHRLRARVQRRPAPVMATSIADELFDTVVLIRRYPRRFLPVIGHGVILEVIGVVELFAAMSAVGLHLGWVVALVGYAIAVLFAIVSILPAGLGFVELSLGAVLIGYGAPVAAASAAVVVFRLFEMWVPLAIGGVCLRRLPRRGET